MYIHRPGKALTVSYGEAGLEQVVGRLQACQPNLIVVEATGGLEVRLATAAAHAGLAAVVVPCATAATLPRRMSG
ncbi:MAG: hypothetical protein KatS3mg077_2545 [Candidatus Binatia bacterium]|nr:MAG: hypothetical protein KatS3mg077_2545 [Candidatus Binatia bacterium]